MFAAKNNYHDALNVLVLVDNTGINEEDKNCMTILMHVLLAKEFKPKLVKRLMHRGADPNHIDKNGNPLLVKLVQLKQTKLVQFMLGKRGLLQHLCDEEGKDACMYAQENGLDKLIAELSGEDCSSESRRLAMVKKREHDFNPSLDRQMKRKNSKLMSSRRSSMIDNPIARGVKLSLKLNAIIENTNSSAAGANLKSSDSTAAALAGSVRKMLG